MSKLNGATGCTAVFLLRATTAIALPAQTFTTRHSFDLRTAPTPSRCWPKATDGHFYGTTEGCGANGEDIVFKNRAQAARRPRFTAFAENATRCQFLREAMQEIHSSKKEGFDST
jgi:hypothetical protein